MQSQSPPVVFEIIHIYFLRIDMYFRPGDLLYVSVPRYTDSRAIKLHLGPKLTDFFLLCVFLGLRPSHFGSRIFHINGNFSGT